MSIDLAPDAEVAELAERTARFVRETVVPVEVEHGGDSARAGDEARVRLQRAAKDAGLFAPHVSPEYGGHGLDMRARAEVFEEAGYSLFGAAGAQHRRAGRGQHAHARAHRNARAEGAVPATPRRR